MSSGGSGGNPQDPENPEDAQDDVLVLPAAPSAALVLFAAPSAPSAAAADEKVRRHARLFTAGEYPDKGVTITEDDLRGVVERFEAEGGPGRAGGAPILTEHRRGLHDPLGACVALHLEPGAGGHLYGTLEFSAGTWAHLKERGVDKLSVALVRLPEAQGGGYELKEVSVTQTPRVPGASILPAGVPAPAMAVAERLAAFRAAGRVTPAMEGPLSRLLSAASAASESSAAEVVFADGSRVDLAREALALVGALPVVQARGAALSPLPGATGGAASGAPASVRGLAAAFGVDPARVIDEMGRC